MNNHVTKQFDAELEQLRDQMLKMGNLVKQQISEATSAFAQADIEKLTSVIETDRLVNELHVSVDQDCSQIIARRQPKAGDLRYIMAVARTVTDLERMGDEAKKIARKGRLILERKDNNHLPLPKVSFRPYTEIVISMIEKALQAFAYLDTTMVVTIAREDQYVDRQFRGIIRHLVTFMLEDPRNISNALEILLIAKAIERIGDHAKNMAEYVIYIVEGRDIRHIQLIEPDDEIELDDIS